MSADDCISIAAASAPTPYRVWLLRIVTAGVIFVSTLGVFSSRHQLFDLCSHFRFQYFVLLAVLTILLWRSRSRKWATLALLALGHNTALVGPYYLPVKSDKYPSDRLSLISFNVHTANRNSADVLKYLQEKSPDVILLIEVDNRWINDLSPLREMYPHVVFQPESHNFGMAIYSRRPILRKEAEPLGPRQPLSICIDLDLNGKPIRLLGTHPYPPMRPGAWRIRNEQLAAVTQKVRESDVPTIVAGDLNATPWCSGFQRLIADGHLTDTARGFGVQRTWNSKIPWIGIPIDHVLATKEWITLRRAVGPHCGSDHYAVEADLALP